MAFGTGVANSVLAGAKGELVRSAEEPSWADLQIGGVIAKLIHSGPNEPSGFILTTILGIVGAFVATYLGQAIGWYRAGEGAGFIGSIVGAVIVLLVWGFLAPRMRRA
jgi:uncharacterized membrane protein YeaQ/YmgE (transglycosylase-associated protein family)